MKPKLAAILLLIVLLPLVLLAWLGVRVAHGEQERVRAGFRSLLLGQLRDVDGSIAELVAERERAFVEATERLPLEPRALREWVRRQPQVAAVFALDPQGTRTYPPPAGPLHEWERAFLRRSEQIWLDKHLFRRRDLVANVADQKADVRSAHGWYTWYWGNDVHLLFWRRYEPGCVLGVEVERVRLLADIVAALPATVSGEPRRGDRRMALLDAKGQTVYQWGQYEPDKGAEPLASLPLSRPLQAWRLNSFASHAELNRLLAGSTLFPYLSGFLVVAVALGGLAAYFYRESSRAVREAAQRVSFVNQVSHELKTPLTNIRMYAELLEGATADEDEKAARYLDVIGSESRRLSRLIGNVLTFARQQRDAVTLHPKPGCVDDVVATTLEHFRPSLEAKGVAIEFDRGAPAEVEVDADALEQILGNLLGNVEKYGASGGRLAVTSRQDGAMTTITVADDGPGISAGERERVFEPFCRVSNKLSDGVTGTGIGLSIARGLARRHGGDLTLEPSDGGACFRITLHTPLRGS